MTENPLPYKESIEFSNTSDYPQNGNGEIMEYLYSGRITTETKESGIQAIKNSLVGTCGGFDENGHNGA